LKGIRLSLIDIQFAILLEAKAELLAANQVKDELLQQFEEVAV
jgi:hypothetical protein